MSGYLVRCRQYHRNISIGSTQVFTVMKPYISKRSNNGSDQIDGGEVGGGEVGSRVLGGKEVGGDEVDSGEVRGDD